MAEWWGLGVDGTLLGLAFLLIVVDLFFLTDAPTHVAWILCAVVIGHNAPFVPLYQVITGVLAWFVLVGFHALFWRKVVERFANRVVAPDRYAGGAAAMIGEVGLVREHRGRRMVRVKGDMWSFRGGEGLGDGDEIEVVGEEDGVLLVAARPTGKG